ncbi:MAG: HAMP domain-containing sensor histidine kinase [Leptolyngbyaceae bacterium]|nr:HAMP domain-containing sensor histidine kinase [Leptolyngbyaceae bacterium]
MKPWHRIIPFLKHALTKHGGIDLRSLQFRMTTGVTCVSVLGIVGVSGWMVWRSQDVVIGDQKRQIMALAEQIPEDIEAYAETLPTEAALEKMVMVRSLPDVSIVVSDDQGDILSHSQSPWHEPQFLVELVNIPGLSMQPSVFQTEGRHYIGCEGPLTINEEDLGTLHVALDITESTRMFRQLMLSLGGATVLAIALITAAIAYYVRRSVQPLRHISRITADLTVEDLDHVQFHLENAPSEVSELAQTCEITLQRLADTMTQQRQFVHDISHELRTPLTVVYGYLQSILRRSQSLNELQKEALEAATSEAERTIRLLQDLLDLARADSGNLQFSLIPIHLNSELEHCLKILKLNHTHPVHLHAAAENIYAMADADRLKQVMFNLIENAIRYSDEDQPVVVKLAETKNSAIIQVCDRGIGISEEHQSQIFNRCYRVDAARSRATGGCGLGLSLVKTLVEGMKGTIHLDSQLNQGSTFTITLPSPQPNDHDTNHRSRRRRREARSLH